MLILTTSDKIEKSQKEHFKLCFLGGGGLILNSPHASLLCHEPTPCCRVAKRFLMQLGAGFSVAKISG